MASAESALPPKARGFDGADDDADEAEAVRRPEAAWRPVPGRVGDASIARAVVAVGRVAGAAAEALLGSAWGAAAAPLGEVAVGEIPAVRVHVAPGGAAALCVCGTGASDAMACAVAAVLVTEGLGAKAPPVAVVQGVRATEVIQSGRAVAAAEVYGLDSDAWKEQGVEWLPGTRLRLPPGNFVSGVAAAVLTRAAIHDEAAGLALVAFPGASHGDAVAVEGCMSLLEDALGVPPADRLRGAERSDAVRRAAGRLRPDHGAMFS